MKEPIKLETSQDRAFGTVYTVDQRRQRWSDGSSVIIFPDGTVLRENTGEVVKEGSQTDKYLNRYLFQMILRQVAPIDKLDDPTLVTTSGTTVARLTSTDTPCRYVRIYASSGNAGTLFIGGSGLNSTNGAIALVAGEAQDIAITNVNKLYYRTTNSGDTFAYNVVQ